MMTWESASKHVKVCSILAWRQAPAGWHDDVHTFWFASILLYLGHILAIYCEGFSHSSADIVKWDEQACRLQVLGSI